MTMPFCGLHYHVVDADFHILHYLVGEYGVHKSLVGGACILEVERHGIMIVVVVV